MTDAVTAPEGGALSVEQATELLDQRIEEREEDDSAEADDGRPEVDAAEDEAEADEADAAEGGFGPQWWSKEAKARFAELPPELQAVVLEQEQKREAVTARAKQEAQEARRRASVRQAEAEGLAEQLGQVVPQAVEAHRSRWASVDWNAVAAMAGAEEVQRLRAQAIAEQQQLVHLAAAQAEASRRAHQAFLADEEDQLAGTELADQGRRGEVARYLLQAGALPERLKEITAMELTIAHKAMLWDRAQAGLKGAPKPRGQAKPVVRPAAATTHVSPRTREARAAKSRFAQTRSIEDAIAWLDAKG